MASPDAPEVVHEDLQEHRSAEERAPAHSPGKRAADITPETVGRRIKSRKVHGNRNPGDPEMTEPDSEDDSLFGDEDFAIEDLKLPAGERGEVPEALTATEVAARRLEHLKELYSLYKVEYWGLMEELRTRHQRFVHKQAKKGLKDPEARQDPEKCAEGNTTSLREMMRLKNRKSQQPTPAAEQDPGGYAVMQDAAAAQPGNADAQPVKGLPMQPHPGALNHVSARDAAQAEAVQGMDRPQSASPPADPRVANFKNPFEPFSVAPVGSTARQSGLPGDDVCGSGSGDDLATFSDAEAALLEEQGWGPAASKQTIQEWRAQYRSRLAHIERLEQAASASTGRELDRLGAMACLCGRHNRFLIKNSVISLGRATDVTQVDIDLSSEGDARKVSRQQAHLSLRPDGRFQLKNVGRRSVLVNNRQVDQGQVAQLGHLSLIEVGGVRLLFMVNHAALRRATARTAQLRA